MDEPGQAAELCMVDGTPFRVQLCVEPGTSHSAEFLRGQIALALEQLSMQSRWMRFASPVEHLSEEQLDYLTDIDNLDRVAWCATVAQAGAEVGIGLGRYVVLDDEPGVAEFALTVVDAYQGRGVGRALLSMLVRSARANGLGCLRGYVLPGNLRMRALCRHFPCTVRRADASTLVVEIDVASVPREGHV